MVVLGDQIFNKYFTPTKVKASSLLNLPDLIVKNSIVVIQRYRVWFSVFEQNT